MKRILVIAFVLLFSTSCRKCSENPVGPAVHVVIDCIAQNQGDLGVLRDELLPLITTGNWTAFYQKAKDAGINIGGCIAAELINKYLAPPPGNAAPSPENGQAARSTMDKLRADFGGATFKTSQGEL